MGIKFAKMHGLGNDFMVIDAINQSFDLDEKLIRHLSNRYTGVGFDQCLLIEQSHSPSIDFNYRIFNADGKEVGQCGNGARCLALFAQYYGLTAKNILTVATKTTQMQLTINKNGTVSVDMGLPKSSPKDIPFLCSHQAASYQLPLKNEKAIPIHVINVGNPHAIVVVDDIQSAPVKELGAEISLHQQFPEQTNAGFMQIIDHQHIRLRVFERGCGETNACGSGAVAAAAIGKLYYNLDQRVKVSLLGGELIIDWPNEHDSIRLTGPASFVYEASLFDLI